MTRLLTENAIFTLALDPASRDETTGSGIYTGTYTQVLGEYITFLVLVGAVTSGDTIDFQVLQATDGSGTSAKNVTSAALTQITATGGSKLYAVSIKADQLDGANGFGYVTGKLTVGGSSAAELTSLVIIQNNLKDAPPTTSGLTQNVILVA